MWLGLTGRGIAAAEARTPASLFTPLTEYSNDLSAHLLSALAAPGHSGFSARASSHRQRRTRRSRGDACERCCAAARVHMGARRRGVWPRCVSRAARRTARSGGGGISGQHRSAGAAPKALPSTAVSRGPHCAWSGSPRRPRCHPWGCTQTCGMSMRRVSIAAIPDEGVRWANDTRKGHTLIKCSDKSRFHVRTWRQRQAGRTLWTQGGRLTGAARRVGPSHPVFALCEHGIASGGV